jgi:hypothetical protein
MTLEQIQQALLRAAKGIAQYGELMQTFKNVDVSEDADFQRRYNAFYRVQRRTADWYRSYYTLMQNMKNGSPVFSDVLDEIYNQTSRYEPSFASKLVATVDPSKPIWDVHILANTNHKAPAYYSKNKFDLAKSAYASIEEWYAKFLNSTEGKLCVSEFDRNFPEYRWFTALKKVDFILWQIRPND